MRQKLGGKGLTKHALVSRKPVAETLPQGSLPHSREQFCREQKKKEYTL